MPTMLIRALLIVLLVLNVGVALWWALGSAPVADAPAALPSGVALLQLAPASSEAIASDAPQPVPTSRMQQCASFGGFPAVNAAEDAGRRLQSGALRVDEVQTGVDPVTVVATAVRQAPVGSPRSWRVLLPPLADADKTRAVAEQIAATGFSDYYVIRDGADANAIALGVFRNETSARDRAATLVKAGFAAVVQPVGAGPLEHWLDIATDGPFEAERLRAQLDVRRTQPLDCAQWGGGAAPGAADLGHTSAAR